MCLKYNVLGFGNAFETLTEDSQTDTGSGHIGAGYPATGVCSKPCVLNTTFLVLVMLLNSETLTQDSPLTLVPASLEPGTRQPASSCACRGY